MHMLSCMFHCLTFIGAIYSGYPLAANTCNGFQGGGAVI